MSTEQCVKGNDKDAGHTRAVIGQSHHTNTDHKAGHTTWTHIRHIVEKIYNNFATTTHFSGQKDTAQILLFKCLPLLHTQSQILG